jgi:uncharacterized protein YndB with AHSA1/START domain
MSDGRTYSIMHDVEIVATCERVFAAISDPVELEQWWPLRCSGVAARGEVYNLFFSDQYDWLGEVSHFKQGREFRIRMTRTEVHWRGTSFGFEILELPNGKVLLQFSHDGWTETNVSYRMTSYCWALLLKGLKDFIEKGVVVPFENRA